MMWELRKMVANRFVIMLLLGAVILNGVLFYRHCTAETERYTMLHMKQKYAQNIDIPAEIQTLEEKAWTADGYGADPSTVTGNLYTELRLDRAVLARMRSGMAGAPGSAGYRAQEMLLSLYSRLDGLTVEPSFSGGVEVLANWNVTELLVLLFPLAAGLVLLVQEWQSGTMALLRTTFRGRLALGLRKYAASVSLLLLGAAVLYGTNLTMSAAFLGLGDLSRPVQSVYGFRGCPVQLTVGGFLLAVLMEKLLWLWMVSSLIFLLCIFARRGALPILTLAAVAGLGAVLANSPNLWLRCTSFTAMADSAARYSRCLILSMGTLPIPERVLCPLVCWFFGAVFTMAGLRCFSVGQAVAADRRSGGKVVLRHTNLLVFEGTKLLQSHAGLGILCGMLLVQLLIYQSYPKALTEYQQDYAHYAAILAGEPSAEKRAFLEEENHRFLEIQGRISKAEEEIEDPLVAQSVIAPLREQLRPMEAFGRAESQYANIPEGAVFAPLLGYERLFGSLGVRDDVRSLLLLLLCLCAALSGVMAVETETGVSVLQRTAGAEGRVNRRKIFLCSLFTVFLVLAAYLPNLLWVRHLYGLPQLCAPATAAGLGVGLPIWGALALAWAVRLGLAFGAMACVLLLSRRTGRTVTALLLSLGALVLPALAALLLL